MVQIIHIIIAVVIRIFRLEEKVEPIRLKTREEKKRFNYALTERERYRKIVAKQAWMAWRALPFNVRTWIGVEDMIEHGMWTAFKFFWRGRYDASRSDAVITSLYHYLHNMYIRDYVSVYGAWKRGWEMRNGKYVSLTMVSLQGMQARLDKTLDEVVGDIPSLVTTEDSIIQNMETNCFVIPALVKVYKQATPKLQSEIVTWFLAQDSKIHTKSKPFQRLAGEFRELCMKEHVKCDDCIHLVTSPVCLDSLSRELCGIPYDLNFPTPGVVDRSKYIQAQRSIIIQ